MASIWWDGAELPQFPSLRRSVSTDVLIIGGGMTGILCAYQLQQAGVDYILAEANTIGSGITKNTTAKLTAQHGLIYHKLMKKLGEERTQMYLQANLAALEQYRTLCSRIDCGYSEQSNYIYSLSDRRKLEQELAALETLHCHADFCEQLPLPIPTAGAVRFPNQAQFHPLKFLAVIAKGLRIYEHTPVRELAPGIAKTDHGIIQAKKIIVATHFPFLNKHGSYFLKMYQHRSYCLAIENAQIVDGMYVDESKTGLSFRNYGDLLILGGGSHRTGKKGGSWAELQAFSHKYYPQSRIQCQWATQDCMTLDGVPYIGRYSARTSDLLVATGFNKWGMTSSMVAANLLTDLLTQGESPYVAVFSPSRSMLHPQLAVNVFESVTNLLSFSGKRCPHMGCALKWNPHEHSWDCPCHGSRFKKDGQLIDNPATNDLNS